MRPSTKFLAVLFAVIVVGGTTPVHAVVLVDENYDSLSLGQTLPNWVSWQPGNNNTLPVTQNTNFNSASLGAVVNNSPGIVRPFAVTASGVISVEIWYDPNTSSSVNTGIAFRSSTNPLSNNNLVFKDENNFWFYRDANNIRQFLHAIDGQGHSIKVDFDTQTSIMDIFFDGVLVADDIAWFGIQQARSVDGLILSSGGSFSGSPSYFDDLKISVTEVTEPSILTLFAIWLAGLGYTRRKRAA